MRDKKDKDSLNFYTTIIIRILMFNYRNPRSGCVHVQNSAAEIK